MQRVCMSGPLLRVEEPPGQADTILGERAVWHRWPETGESVVGPRDPDVPNPYTQPAILGGGSASFWQHVVDQDPLLVTASVSTGVLHGRSTVEADFRGQGGQVLHLVVDGLTGIWLEARIDGELWAEWLEISFAPTFEPDCFEPVDPGNSSA